MSVVTSLLDPSKPVIHVPMAHSLARNVRELPYARDIGSTYWNYIWQPTLTGFKPVSSYEIR